MLKIVERHARGIQIPVCYLFYVSENGIILVKSGVSSDNWFSCSLFF